MRLASSNVAQVAAVLACLAGGMIAFAGPGNGNGNGSGSGSGSTGTSPSDPFAAMPSSIRMDGVVRDFRARNAAGGHTDFEYTPVQGFGHYAGMVQDSLDASGLPVFASKGYKVSTQFRDSQGRNIMPDFGKAYIATMPGDTVGAKSAVEGGAMNSANSFNQWFRDVPGVNMSAVMPITLVREPGTNKYVFDDQVDTHYTQLEGFFCVNGRLLGANGGAQGGNKNYHFTYTIDSTFTYRAGQGMYIAAKANDDLWIFVNGKLVIDLGGVAANTLQRIDLDRLTNVVDGQEARLQIFYANRNRPQCNLRLEMSMAMKRVDPPPITDAFD